MKRVNILDCTLRDGAYLIDSQFGNTAIKGIIEGLTESGIDVMRISERRTTSGGHNHL